MLKVAMGDGDAPVGDREAAAHEPLPTPPSAVDTATADEEQGVPGMPEDEEFVPETQEEAVLQVQEDEQAVPETQEEQAAVLPAREVEEAGAEAEPGGAGDGWRAGMLAGS
jgi:hypothetical protein